GTYVCNGDRNGIRDGGQATHSPGLSWLPSAKEHGVSVLRFISPPNGSSLLPGEISTCCYSPDGQFVLSGGWDGTLRLWDVSAQRMVASIKVGAKPLSACA